MADENDENGTIEVAPAPADIRNTYTRKKKGADIIDQWGKREKKNRPIGMDLSDIVLPPFTRKTIATYRIIGTGEISRSTGEPVEPVNVSIPGTYSFYDSGEKDPARRMKFMRNLGRPEIVIDPVSKKEVLDDAVVNPIIFIRGVLRVDVEKQYPLYVFMELYPLNKSNKFRDTKVVPLFERIDLNNNRSLAFKQAEQDMAYEAETIVMQMDKDTVIARATSAGIPTMDGGKQRGLSDVKSDLRVFARNNPRRFFSQGAQYKAAIKMHVLDALAWEFIRVNEAKRQFYSALTEEPIHTWLVQEDPTDSLVNFFATPEGTEIYEAFKNQVEYWDRG